MRPAQHETGKTMRIGLSFLVTVLFLTCADAWADSIRLKDGSHIVGVITGINGGKLVVKTEFAGDISIVLDAILSIETDKETGYKLDTGEVHSGQLFFDEGRQELLIGDADIDAALGAIVAIGDPVKLSGPMVNWSGRAQFGATFEEGDTDELDFDALVSTTRTSDAGRLVLLVRGEYGETNDVRTDNAVFSSARYEYDQTERRYLLGIAQLEYDEFEDLDIRHSVGGGLGYFFVKRERQILKGFTGLIYQHEQFGNGTRTDDLLSPIGYEYRLDLRDRLRFRSDSIFFTNLTTTDNWRITAENAIEVPISSQEGWKIRLGVRNKYDNDVQPGIEKLDTVVYSSLVYDWD